MADRNKEKGVRIEPCGAPAGTWIQLEKLSLRTTRCLRPEI